MAVKILAGRFKNRMIETPKTTLTRPTSSKVRAQVFNICQHVIDEASFLDLFSGSGAMGLEALSRGAKYACFVDVGAQAMRAVRENIGAFEVGAIAKTLQLDVCSAVKKLHQDVLRGVLSPFDIIFIDPPYCTKGEELERSQSMKVVQALDEYYQLASEQCWLFVEEGRFFPIEKVNLQHWMLVSSRATGDSYLHELRRRAL